MEVPAALQRIEHIVVLQLENRSFDHALGYLATGEPLPQHPGEHDTEVDGLRDGLSNTYRGATYSPEPLDEDVFDSKQLDPPHDAPEVATQIAGGTMSGFLDAWAAKLHHHNGWLLLRELRRLTARLRGRPYPDPQKLRAVMGHLTRDKVPVFDHLARHFCVCDRWFCSVAGPTMPNRFASIAGTHDGEMSNIKLLVFDHGKFHSLFRYLEHQRMWRWYSSDPGILRAIDGCYRFDIDPDYDHFAYFDRSTDVQPRTFLSDVLQTGELPEVAWIDPNFAIAKMGVPFGGELDGPGSNDDHPPSRVFHAQKLVNQVYEALGRSRYWDTTLLIVFYDEHGGFYDHVAPPDGHGPRIPALLAGGRVKRGVCHDELDHASIIRTILLRFGEADAIARMPPAVAAANDLSVCLRDDDELVRFVPVADAGPAAITDDDLVPKPMEGGAAKLDRAFDLLDQALTNLQELIVRYHAIPLRTGRARLPAIPNRRVAKLAVRVAPKKAQRLPPRRP